MSSLFCIHCLPTHKAKVQKLRGGFCFHQILWVKLSPPALSGRCTVERNQKEAKMSRARWGETGHGERFIGSNEGVGGVQVVVLWLWPVSIMDLASQRAIDCIAHNLVLLLFLALAVCQPAMLRLRTRQNLLPDDRYSVQLLSHYLWGGLG